jgi:hypothetical protein
MDQVQRYAVECRRGEGWEWQRHGTWNHTLDSAIKCQRFLERMKGLQTRRVPV